MGKTVPLILETRAGIGNLRTGWLTHPDLGLDLHSADSIAIFIHLSTDKHK
jgi:hypothetical protein